MKSIIYFDGYTLNFGNELLARFYVYGEFVWLN